MNQELPPWEQIEESLGIWHPTDATKLYRLQRNKFGTYWLENREGEGMKIAYKNQLKIFDFIDKLFNEDF